MWARAGRSAWAREISRSSPFFPMTRSSASSHANIDELPTYAAPGVELDAALLWRLVRRRASTATPSFRTCSSPAWRRSACPFWVPTARRSARSALPRSPTGCRRSGASQVVAGLQREVRIIEGATEGDRAGLCRGAASHGAPALQPACNDARSQREITEIMRSRVERLAEGPIRRLLQDADALVIAEPQNVFLHTMWCRPPCGCCRNVSLMPVFHARSEPFWVIADITEKAFREQSEFIRDFVVYTEYKTSPTVALAARLARARLRPQAHPGREELPAHHVLMRSCGASFPASPSMTPRRICTAMRMIKTADEHAELQRRCNLTLRAICECYRETQDRRHGA